jgi:hypothetical protein
VLTQLRVGPPDNINGRDVQVVQGNGARGSSSRCISTGRRACSSGWCASPARRSAARRRRSTSTIIATLAGAGIKMPFRWTFGWLDGRDTIEIKRRESKCARGRGRL